MAYDYLNKLGLGMVWQKVKTLLAAKADLASPEFTGTPTAPTATSGTNTTQIATTAFVQSAVASGGVTVDTTMSDTSTNPVQNKVIKGYVDTAVDLSGYVQDSEMASITETEINQICV